MTTTTLAETCAGTPYGHVPGHRFHDVEVVITLARGRFRVAITEKYGSAQGYDEVHCSSRVVGRGDTLTAAAYAAERYAVRAGFNAGYLSQALSQAIDEAEDAIEASAS